MWHLPDDLKRFKALTMGHPILMGRKTFDSIGRALPGRTCIVITRSENFEVPGVLPTTSLEKALSLAAAQDASEGFIIGGGEVYRQALERGIVDCIYLTRVHAVVEGDTYFEIPDGTQWKVEGQVAHPSDERHAFAFDFIDLIKQTD